MGPARLATAALLAVGCATTPVRGVVFVDHNGDGLQQSGEPGVANAVVAFERSVFATTRADGTYALEVPSQTGMIWVRVPDGFRPGPVWRALDTMVPTALPLTPLSADEAASPITFVVAADSHAPPDSTDPWEGGDLGDAIDQATSLPQPPRFFTIVGDITQSNKDAEFDRVQTALADIAVPWIPVAGNHDWYDGGRNYRRYFGVDNYSFDIGDIHFIVWDTNLAEQDQIAFLTAELAHVADEMTVVAMGHGSPTDPVADEMNLLGVDYLFTGHWHANRRVQRGAITEWGTQTFIMGGIDQSPSGYRVITFVDGIPVIEHRERLVRGHLDLVAPHAGTCAPPGGGTVIAAAALDASRPEVTMRIDCGPEIALAPVGGWGYRGDLPALALGTHSLTLSAVTASGRRLAKQVGFEVCTRTAPVLAFTDWPQLGGSAEHAHARPAPVAPPLAVQWTATIGGSLSLGSPVVAGQLAIVAITDNGGGDRGGLVALELATGVERWRYLTPFPAVAAAAVSGDTVVVATKNGEVHAVALADGALRWRHDAGEGLRSFETGLWGPPTIADGLVYVALQGNFTALDLVTGEPVWARDPEDPLYTWLGSLAAVAVSEGQAIAAFNRTLGLKNWSATTGAERWSVKDGRTAAVNASPVIDAGMIYVVNAAGEVSAATLATGQILWTRKVTPMGFDWGYSVTATPAIANGRLFVATQWSDLVALDAASGAELWRTAAPGGPLNYAHYRAAEPGFPASPVVTGDIVWIGALDGQLLALAADDGRLLWSTQLGAPVVSAPAPTGDALVVASYDGSVRLLAPAAPAQPAAVTVCDPSPAPDRARGASGCAVGHDGEGLLALGLAGLVRRRRRRRRRDHRRDHGGGCYPPSR